MTEQGSQEQRLTFVRLTGERSADKHILAEYLCSCGQKVVVRRSRVKHGYTRSCGCLATENLQAVKHGHHGSRTYASWIAMRRRCLVTTDKDYPRWGGRGIRICPQWGEFENFLADMGERPEGTTLDRVDVDADYAPDNCRWATPSEQQRNRRDSHEWVIKGDRFPTLQEAADRFGVTKQTVRRWVVGQYDARRDTFTKPLEDCHAVD
jgi:hypothetical protein